MPTHPGGSDAKAAQDKSTSVASGPCLVQTTIGSIQGFIEPSFPGVRQWLGVPFAEPPIGDQRFAPPVPKKAFAEGEVFSATKMPLAPMQAHTTKSDFYATYVPEFLPSGPYSENCLYLNVFGPRDVTKDPLPTLVFFYGGEGLWGGINTQYFQPLNWVQGSQKHIVALFNYRVGIFGFPNAKGLSEGPLGLLDQRRALEFLRDNIAAFGGSPEKLIGLGHTAGSYSIQAHLFAWPDDPILSAAICLSGFLHQAPPSLDMDRESFTLIARRLGCPENASSQEKVAFLRAADAGAIMGCVRTYMDSDVEPKLFFRPQEDGVFIFSIEEQLRRARQGKFASVPTLLCTTSHEGNALAPCRGMAAGDQNATASAAKTTSMFEQALRQVLEYRVANGHTTYKALYAGDFVNISPRPWMKAYHFSELPMIMGTHEIERGPSTTFQRELSTIMQTMLVDFARDPARGLSKWGWTPASRDDSSPMVLGKDGVLFQQRETASSSVASIGEKQKDPVSKVLTERDGKQKGRWRQWISRRNRDRIPV